MLRISITPILSTLLVAIILTGCHSLKITEPKRSAGEQLLLSTAVDHALTNVDLSPFKGRRVFVEETYFESYDGPYALGSIRETLSAHGALLVSRPDEAQIIVEARAGGLGIDTRTSLIGIPEIPVPIPLAGTFTIPEIALFKSEKADATGKLALFAYDRETRAFLHSTGSMSGTAQFYYYKVLGLISWRRTDIPEFDPKLAKRLAGDQTEEEKEAAEAAD